MPQAGATPTATPAPGPPEPAPPPLAAATPPVGAGETPAVLEVAYSPSSGGSGSSRTTWLHSRSSWRWPSGPGKLPHYVKGRFRAKTFGLLSLQLAVVFGAMVGVELLTDRPLRHANLRPIFYALELGNLFLLLALHCLRDRYPMNYLLLGVITLMLAVRWGIGPSFLYTWLHFQVVGILSVTTCTAAAVSAFTSTDGWPAVMFPLALGWALGSTLDLMLTIHFKVSVIWTSVAIFITFCLLIWLLVDMGGRLVDCNPDDFMRVVISMNSTLLVVVSIPVFAFGTFMLHAVDGSCSRREEVERAEGVAAV